MAWTSNTTLAAVAGVGIAAVGYVAWFDYRRRHDAGFRRQLRKEREAVRAKSQRQAKQGPGVSPLLGDLSDVPPERQPTSPQEHEAYFMELLSTGERLLGMGPSRFDAAAVCYFRALKIYPDPMKLLEVLQQTMPEPVMNKILMLLSEDVRKQTQAQAQAKAAKPKAAAAAAAAEAEDKTAEAKAEAKAEAEADAEVAAEAAAVVEAVAEAVASAEAAEAAVEEAIEEAAEVAAAEEAAEEAADEDAAESAVLVEATETVTVTEAGTEGGAVKATLVESESTATLVVETEA